MNYEESHFVRICCCRCLWTFRWNSSMRENQVQRWRYTATFPFDSSCGVIDDTRILHFLCATHYAELNVFVMCPLFVYRCCRYQVSNIFFCLPHLFLSYNLSGLLASVCFCFLIQSVRMALSSLLPTFRYLLSLSHSLWPQRLTFAGYSMRHVSRTPTSASCQIYSRQIRHDHRPSAWSRWWRDRMGNRVWGLHFSGVKN